MNMKLFHDKNFSLLMITKFISIIGTRMQDFALSLYVLKKTGSATLFASVLIVGIIPQIILTPVAGVFADWLDRKKMIIYLDMLSGIVITCFAVLYMVRGELSLLNIYILVAILSLCSTFYQPTIGTIVPMIVKEEYLVEANGLNSIIMNLGSVIAPLIAGILFGFHGLFVIMIVNAISFAVGSIIELGIDIPKVSMKSQKINFKAFYVDFSQGIKFIRNRKIILQVIILAPILNFVLTPLLSIGVTYVSKSIFKVSDSQYGFMEMASVLSMMIAPFCVSNYIKTHSLGKILFGGILISSILIAVMAFIPTPLYLSLFRSNLIPFISFTIIVFLIGGLLATINIALMSMFQKLVPISMLGRVGAVMSTGCMSFIPLGQLFFGMLFDNLSAWICILISSLILFITILIFKNTLLSAIEDEGCVVMEQKVTT
ncbi:MFS transporter [Clostridium sp. CF012]|uniref:MFS transporter n=1 Tax=Clostridium sp. CF012 TaxID=2843319 RepID=UPI001C0E4DDD|nr:MFS transporter [Clostridium sp. CF012]MBU3146731.1 MFS transporter [Clostridium sp. CF012]